MTTRKLSISLIGTLLLLLVSACGNRETPAQGPTATRSPVPSPQASQTAAPSTTPLPTAVPSRSVIQSYLTRAAATAQAPAAGLDETRVAQTNVAYNATESAGYLLTSTAIVQAIQATVTPRVFQSLRSPDGKWLAEVILYDCAQISTSDQAPTNSYELLKISGQVVDRQLLYCGGQGAAGFAGHFWSADSRFFYYTDAREGWPDGGYPWRRPISRFDTTAWKSETLGGAVYSPNQQKIAGAQGAEMVVWDIQSGAAERFTGPVEMQPWINWIAWSPDGHSLAYLTQINCQNVYPCPSTLTRADLGRQSVTRLLDGSSPPMLTVEWPRTGQLTLWGADFNSWYALDLATKKLSFTKVSTITPGPPPTRTPPRFTETPIPTYAPDPAFPADLYPPAAQFRQPVDRGAFDLRGHGCPGLAGIEPATRPEIDTLAPVLEAVRSGDVYRIRQASDVAYWPVSGLSLPRQVSAFFSSSSTVKPAAQSPWASLLTNLCGEAVVQGSWWAHAEAPDGVTDYFLLYRKNRWLVWLSILDYAQFQQ